jgi:RNA polymerase sigma-70 factor (ECF subfamily)
LLRLTTNQAIDHRRAQKRHRRGVSLDAVDGDALAPVDSKRADADARRHEIDARVQRALDVLSPSQRTAFVMRHYEHVPLAEIAPVLGCSVGSVKVHLFRALRKLREELKDLDPGVDAHEQR